MMTGNQIDKQKLVAGCEEFFNQAVAKGAAGGTLGLLLVDSYKVLQQQNKQLQAFKKYFSELYGEGLEIANWHQNGDTEPFDNFFDSAVQEEAEV